MAIARASAVLGALLFGCHLFGLMPAERDSAAQTMAPRWNPMKVPASASFIGPQACAECHTKRVSVQERSPMGMAMESVSESKILSAHQQLEFRSGPYTYRISRRGSESIYTVTDGRETITLPIHYAFGQGKAGQTYVFEHNGEFIESRVSFYNEIDGLDLTIGQTPAVPASLSDALGRRLNRTEVLKCFGCHSMGAVKGGELKLENLTHGVRCESCHGPGGEHAAAGRKGLPNKHLIFNPARLSGDELTQEFCAACHRGNEELTLLRSFEINNVRFQPYRLFQSRCYSDDRRVSCTACHDPHDAAREDAAYYDAKCLACHEAGKAKAAGGNAAEEKAVEGKAAEAKVAGCKVGTKDCASCHMPKVEIPGSHFKFSDHFIRVVKPNDRYPN